MAEVEIGLLGRLAQTGGVSEAALRLFISILIGKNCQIYGQCSWKKKKCTRVKIAGRSLGFADDCVTRCMHAVIFPSTVQLCELGRVVKSFRVLFLAVRRAQLAFESTTDTVFQCDI